METEIIKETIGPIGLSEYQIRSNLKERIKRKLNEMNGIEIKALSQMSCIDFDRLFEIRDGMAKVSMSESRILKHLLGD